MTSGEGMCICIMLPHCVYAWYMFVLYAKVLSIPVCVHRYAEEGYVVPFRLETVRSHNTRHSLSKHEVTQRVICMYDTLILWTQCVSLC